MIKVMLKNGEQITGDWETAVVQPHRGSGGTDAITLSLKGQLGEANFVLSEVIGWMTVVTPSPIAMGKTMTKAGESK